MARLLARIRPYGLALLCAAGAVALRWALDPVLADDLPLVTAYAFAALAVWVSGWAPALCMAFASYLALHWLFVPPRAELIPDSRFFWNLFAYAVGVVPVIVIGEAMRRAQQHARDQAGLLRAKQTALEDSEERYRSLVSVVTDVPWATDAAGEFVVPQPAWEAYTGQPWEEHRGSGWVNALHPEDRERVKVLWKKACETGTAYESRGRLWHAATKQWRHYVGRGAPLFAPDGTIRAWVGAATDVDITMRMTHALRESEERSRMQAERLRQALDAGEMGSWEVDFRAGTLVWDTRQHEIFDRPLDEPPRNIDDFYALVHPDDVEPIRRAYAEAAGQPTGHFEVEFRITRGDGEVRWIAGQAETIADELGQLVRVVGINYDVTERREAQARLQSFAEELERQVATRTEQLVRSEEQLRAMAADLTLAEQRERQRFATELHDHLQQMLVFCKLKLGRAKQLGLAAPEIPALHAEIDETLSRALAYSRSLVAELSPPVLRELGFASALNWLGEWMETLDLVVSVELGEPQRIALPEAHAVLLFRSVRELLINAAKYAGTGRASVRMERSDGELRVTVSDEGRGFDPAAVASVHAPATAKFGLFSIRERMKTLGGSMHVESNPGRGTRATLTLPFVPVAPPSAEALASRTHEARTSASRGTRSGERPAVISVLLVDDHAVVREGLRNVLSEYDDLDVVGEAQDGEDAVVCVERLRPSVVVMDINMPRKNGIAATAEITARWPDVVVIGLSVNADRGSQEAMKLAGAAMLLPKEAAVDDLYRSIQRVVNR